MDYQGSLGAAAFVVAAAGDGAFALRWCCSKQPRPVLGPHIAWICFEVAGWVEEHFAQCIRHCAPQMRQRNEHARGGRPAARLRRFFC